MITCLVTQNSPAMVIFCFFTSLAPSRCRPAPGEVLGCSFPGSAVLRCTEGPAVAEGSAALSRCGGPGPGFAAPPLQLGLLHHRYDTQSAKRLGLLIKQMAADAGIIIHAYMTTQEASFVSTWPHPRMITCANVFSRGSKWNNFRSLFWAQDSTQLVNHLWITTADWPFLFLFLGTFFFDGFLLLWRSIWFFFCDKCYPQNC